MKRILGLLGQKTFGVREQQGAHWKDRSDIEKWVLKLRLTSSAAIDNEKV